MNAVAVAVEKALERMWACPALLPKEPRAFALIATARRQRYVAARIRRHERNGWALYEAVCHHCRRVYSRRYDRPTRYCPDCRA